MKTLEKFLHGQKDNSMGKNGKTLHTNIRQEWLTKKVEADTERAKEKFTREWLGKTPITGDKRKAEAISDDDDSIKSDYDGRINRKNHLKRPRLQDDKQQGEQRILPLNKILSRSDFVLPKEGKQERIIERIWNELDATALGTGGETPIFDEIMRRLMDPSHKKNVPTAIELAKMLNEPNLEEMKSLYKACGPAFMLKVYLRTVYVERRGGMSTDLNGKKQRRRTSGGVFFRLTRYRYHLTDEQVEARDKIIDDNFCQFQDQCLQEIEAGGNVKEKLLCQTKRPEPSGPLYEP